MQINVEAAKLKDISTLTYEEKVAVFEDVTRKAASNGHVAQEQPVAADIEHEQVLKQILDALEKVDFREEANLEDGQNLNNKHWCVVSVRKIVETAQALNCGLCKHTAFVYVYNGKYWRQMDKEEMTAFLGQAAEKLGVEPTTAQYHKFRDELLKQFMATAYLPRPERNREAVLINLANGTFEITPTSQKKREHRRKDFMTYMLPFDYDKDAACSQWDAFLKKVLPDEEGRQEECDGISEEEDHQAFEARQKILAEFIGYCFTSMKLEKVLMPYGTGANGKSVFFDVITALLGEENISHYGLNHLTHEYNRAMVADKLLNYASEVSSKLESETFKQMASGEPVQARLPYAPPFTMRNYARMAFNANELPRAVEHNKAFFRRFLIVPFDVTVSDEEQDTELARKIIAAELPGVFNWVLDGLRRLLKEKKFTECAAVKRALATYQKESDSVAMFISDEGWLPDPDMRAQATLRDIYEDYKKYCGDNGYKPLGKQNFARRLEAIGMKKSGDSKPRFFVYREAR
jgi:putative DNA primase/helicase